MVKANGHGPPRNLACFFCKNEIGPGEWMSVRSQHYLGRRDGKLEITSGMSLDQACPACSIVRGRLPPHPWPEPPDRCLLCAATPGRSDRWHHVIEEITVLGPAGEIICGAATRLASFCDECVSHAERAPLDRPFDVPNGLPGVPVEDIVTTLVGRGARAEDAGSACPTAAVIAGPIAAGKTTLRRQRYADGWVTLDPADIYLALTRTGSEVPTDIRKRVEQAGHEIVRRALAERRNIVIELVLWNPAAGAWILRAFKDRGYHTTLVGVECDVEECERRNRERGPHEISCFHTQPMLMRWLLAMLPPGGSPRLDEALAYAVLLHRDQVRKGTRVPYSTHLLGVASLVGEAGGTEDEMIAALLHDAVEDQGGKRILEEIRARFGDPVAEIVAACSDTDVEPKPPWHERKRAYLGRLRQERNPSVLLVSAADKLHNARAILADLRVEGDSVFERFSATKEDTLLYYRALVDAYRDSRAPARLVDELRRTVDGILAEAAPP